MGRKLLMGCLILFGMLEPHLMLYLFFVLGLIAGEGPVHAEKAGV
jgi:hypothetical protein